MDIEVGKYLAKIVDFGIGSTANKKAQVFVEFELKQGGKRIRWFGPLGSEKAVEFSLRNLLKMGFNGDWQAFSAGNDLSIMECDTEWELDIQEQSFDGKTYKKIQWINKPGETPAAPPKESFSDAMKIVNSMNLKGVTAKLQAEMGVGQKKAVGEGDVPF